VPGRVARTPSSDVSLVWTSELARRTTARACQELDIPVVSLASSPRRECVDASQGTATAAVRRAMGLVPRLLDLGSTEPIKPIRELQPRAG
jgi:hypothetical protein